MVAVDTQACILLGAGTLAGILALVIVGEITHTTIHFGDHLTARVGVIPHTATIPVGVTRVGDMVISLVMVIPVMVGEDIPATVTTQVTTLVDTGTV